MSIVVKLLINYPLKQGLKHVVMLGTILSPTLLINYPLKQGLKLINIVNCMLGGTTSN